MKKYIILGLLVTVLFGTQSCKKWLDVNSNTEITSDEQFSDITGFRDAVIGVYVKMAKPAMYSQEMTWRTVEFLSQQYGSIEGAPDIDVPRYAWGASALVSKRERIWLSTYEAIANINQVLSYQEQNRSVFSSYPLTDSLIHGEMLALRAFLHFDLMRLYGKGNLGNRPELMDKPTIPYVKSFSRLPTDQHSYRETISLMRKDLEEAIKYLECDPLSRLRGDNPNYWAREEANGFISTETKATVLPNRRIRMNYWAAKAVYARVLLWEGTSESKVKALEVALEIIGETNSNGIGNGAGAHYSWTSPTAVEGATWQTSDLSFVNEQLFTLNVEKFQAIQEADSRLQRNWFYAGSPNDQYTVAYLTETRRNAVFESGTSLIDADWRANKCLFADGATFSNWTIAKFYNTKETPATYNRRMPLIRVTEMYYIAAECLLEQGADYNRTKSLALLNKVRNQRNIPTGMDLESSLSDQEIREEITKEYRKEFIAEGQLFYYYKRIGAPHILGYDDEMTDVEYQMPMPDSEKISGGLRED